MLPSFPSSSRAATAAVAAAAAAAAPNGRAVTFRSNLHATANNENRPSHFDHQYATPSHLVAGQRSPDQRSAGDDVARRAVMNNAAGLQRGAISSTGNFHSAVDSAGAGGDRRNNQVPAMTGNYGRSTATVAGTGRTGGGNEPGRGVGGIGGAGANGAATGQRDARSSPVNAAASSRNPGVGTEAIRIANAMTTTGRDDNRNPAGGERRNNQAPATTGNYGRSTATSGTGRTGGGNEPGRGVGGAGGPDGAATGQRDARSSPVNAAASSRNPGVGTEAIRIANTMNTTGNYQLEGSAAGNRMSPGFDRQRQQTTYSDYSLERSVAAAAKTKSAAASAAAPATEGSRGQDDHDVTTRTTAVTYATPLSTGT